MKEQREWAHCWNCRQDRWLTMAVFPRGLGWGARVAWVCRHCGFENSEMRLRLLSAGERVAYGLQRV